ncbi:MAG TPA: ABC transporter ATP-binding protein [Nitrososphaera sp.]|nr:ABC transporter ATP-binding protein [Nitrososphaera sp.]
MENIAIRVENLSKQYKIGLAQHRHDTLRDQVVNGLRSLLLRNGRPSDIIFWALKDISLEIKQGEVVGIIGRNGAGKSTLLKILSRITEPTAGIATIQGRVRSLLEVGTGFHPELTGRENVYLNGAIMGMKKAEIVRKFDQIVAFAEVDGFIDTPVKRYSSGMYVRLAFAVAAHLEPEIMIVDEVLAVGDTAFQRKCLGKMGDVAKEGMTVLFVSHNMAAMQGLCSKCFLLTSGQLVAEGVPETVVGQYLADVSDGTPAVLGQRKDRQGSGKIQFQEVSILDGNGRPIDLALSGQDIEIALSYRSRDGKPISRLDAHITFYTMLGQFMFTCSSESSGHLLDVLPADGRLVCRIPELPLSPGRYVINLFSTVGGVIADWVQQASYINVAAGDYFGTGQLRPQQEGFLVKNKWTVRTPCSPIEEVK